MGCKVVIHTAKTVQRFKPIYARAQKFLDNEVLKDSSPYTPFRTGALMRSGISGTKIGSGKVVWEIDYAKRCYYGTGMNFSKEKHPQASAQWFEKAKAVNKKKWIEGTNKAIKGG